MTHRVAGIRRALGALLFAMTLGVPTEGQAPRAGSAAPRIAGTLDTARISAVLRAEMEATGAPGASIAIVIGDRIAYRAAFGVRSVETRDPMTTATLVRLGSVTKSFTGLVASILADDGRLDLHVPVARIDTALDREVGARTMHELLTHTGGLADEAARDGPHDEDALAERVRGWDRSRLLADAADVYSYASPGYWLAGHMVQHADGTPYADVVTRRVLVPLGMHASTFRPLEALTRSLAIDHRVVNGRAEVLRPFQDDASTWPSGSLFSSVDDLARYATALMHGGRLEGRQVLPESAVARMFAAVGALPGSACGYSYGLSVCERAGQRTASHYGFRVGSGAVFTLLPDAPAAIIILANRNGGIMGRTESAVVRMLATAAGIPARATVVTPPPRAAPTVTATREEIVGAWENGGAALRISLAGDSLAVTMGEATNPARLRADAVQVLNERGQSVQQFRLVRGARSGRLYLHDGLNALARRAAR
jgi:CubicO group peptidase (beta-lactamase class C family)